VLSVQVPIQVVASGEDFPAQGALVVLQMMVVRTMPISPVMMFLPPSLVEDQPWKRQSG
jgi:hypothetical protein